MTNPIIQIKRVQNFEQYNAYTGGYLQFGEMLFDQNRKTVRIGTDGGVVMGNAPVFFPGQDFNYCDAASLTLDDTLPANATANNVTKQYQADETCWYLFTANATTPNTAISHLDVVVDPNGANAYFSISGVVKENTSQGLLLLLPLTENQSVNVITRACTAVSIYKIPIVTTQVLTTWDEGV
ncbi:MAG: hypothetical protein J6Y02_13175 [Pseudobutyrivibrio sp.]|nr:hypothetical protein [Pseudobutyrivibrio sp.]